MAKLKIASCVAAPLSAEQVRTLARKHTEAAVTALAEIIDDASASPAARVSAANALLDRGWGRAPQHVSVNRSPFEDMDGPTLDLAIRLLEAVAAKTRDAAAGDEAGPVH